MQCVCVVQASTQSYQHMEGMWRRTCCSPLNGQRLSSFPLLITHDGGMRVHINLPIGLLLFQLLFLSLYKLSNLFCLLTPKNLIKRRFTKVNISFTLLVALLLSVKVSPPWMDVVLSRLAEQSLFLIILFLSKQATLTHWRFVSFSNGWLCTNGWQSCWQKKRWASSKPCLDSTSGTCSAAREKTIVLDIRARREATVGKCRRLSLSFPSIMANIKILRQRHLCNVKRSFWLRLVCYKTRWTHTRYVVLCLCHRFITWLLMRIEETQTCTDSWMY